MEVYQQVSIIRTGYCSGTRDISFHPGAACCHWSILFQYNQWSFDTRGTSRIMANKPSPLWEEQLVAMNHAFASPREDGQYINTSLLKLFLRNAFLKNRLGNVGLCTREHTPASCRNDTVPLLHTQLQMEKTIARKLKVIFFFFLHLKEQSSNNKWFCVKRSLPSDLKLNISFSCTASKAKDTMHWSCDRGTGRGIFTSRPTDWHLDANLSSCWMKLNRMPPALLRKGSWPPGNCVFLSLCTRSGEGWEFFLISPMEALPWVATESTAATQLESCLATGPNSTFLQHEKQH